MKVKLREDDFVYLDDSNFVVQSSSEEQTSRVNMKHILDNQKKLEQIGKEVDRTSLLSDSYEYVKSNERIQKIIKGENNE